MTSFIATCCASSPRAIATFRLEDENENQFFVLSTRIRFKERKCLKCECSELRIRTRRRPRTPI